eukprot:1161596-Pelagomonas_calceolata.AAC.17
MKKIGQIVRTFRKSPEFANGWPGKAQPRLTGPLMELWCTHAVRPIISSLLRFCNRKLCAHMEMVRPLAHQGELEDQEFWRGGMNAFR